MKIADLFVQLGVKGTEKSVSAIGSISKGISGIVLGATAAAGAITGAVYALKRLGDQSSKEGTTLKNFNTLTGLSTKQLQQYQYAARQVGASNEDMISTITGIQQKIGQMKLTGEVPKGFGWVASTVGLPEDINDTFALFQKLQEFVQKFKDDPNMRDVLKNVLGDFGVSGDIASGMFQNAFNEDVFKKAQLYSDNQIKALDQVRNRWDNIGRKFEMMFGRLNIKFAGGLVTQIDQLIPKVEKLVSSFIVLSEKLKVFEIMGGAFNFLSSGLDTAGSMVDDINKGKNPFDALKFKFQEKYGRPPQGTPININNQQTLNFNGQVIDPQAVGNAAGQATTQAWKDNTKQAVSTMNSRGQAN